MKRNILHLIFWLHRNKTLEKHGYYVGKHFTELNVYISKDVDTALFELPRIKLRKRKENLHPFPSP
jgi:hypothetical protein